MSKVVYARLGGGAIPVLSVDEYNATNDFGEFHCFVQFSARFQTVGCFQRKWDPCSLLKLLQVLVYFEFRSGPAFSNT